MKHHKKRTNRPKHRVLRRSFAENSSTAWTRIKAFCRKPRFWVALIAVTLALTGAVFLIRFLPTVRAPELIPVQTEPEQQLPPEEIDDSNAVQPLLSGERKEDFYTFLLFGTDKAGTNTDTIMVASYDVKNQKLSLMSIPRDTMVNVNWDIKKINSVYGRRGVEELKNQIGKLIGFTPDFYVKIDLQAFVDVVDLIGGVEFDVPVPMHYHDPYQKLSIDLEPGLQLLNGQQAMGLVRFRKSDLSAGKRTGYNDTGRVQTQQEFLKAMFKKCLKLTNWTKISSYVEIFQRNVESELTTGNMLWFARQAMDLSEDGFFTVTAPGNYSGSAYSRSTGAMQSYVTLNGRDMVKLVNERFNPYLTPVTLSNLDIMGINADGSVYSSTGHVADSRAALPVVRETSEKSENPGQSEETEKIAAEPENPETSDKTETPPEPSEPTTDQSLGGETPEPGEPEPPSAGDKASVDEPSDAPKNEPPGGGRPEPGEPETPPAGDKPSADEPSESPSAPLSEEGIPKEASPSTPTEPSISGETPSKNGE